MTAGARGLSLNSRKRARARTRWPVHQVRNVGSTRADRGACSITEFWSTTPFGMETFRLRCSCTGTGTGTFTGPRMWGQALNSDAPGAPLGRVGNIDAEGDELGAELVGKGKVFVLASFGALAQLSLDDLR